MHKDRRPSFAEAKEQFLQFLISQRWSTRCVWLAETRARRKKGRILVFRSDRDSDESSAATLYNEILSTDSSIKLIGVAQQSDRSIVVVQKYKGDPGHFYMSLSQAVPEVVEVSSRLLWKLRLLDRGLKTF